MRALSFAGVTLAALALVSTAAAGIQSYSTVIPKKSGDQKGETAPSSTGTAANCGPKPTTPGNWQCVPTTTWNWSKSGDGASTGSAAPDASSATGWGR